MAQKEEAALDAIWHEMQGKHDIAVLDRLWQEFFENKPKLTTRKPIADRGTRGYDRDEGERQKSRA